MEQMEKKCIHCGTSLAPGEKFCPNCGTPAPAPEPVQSAPQPAPAPEPVQPAPQPAPAPEPVQSAPQPAPAPEPVQPAPQPAPAPEPVQPAPQPAPAPEPVQPAPQPVPAPQPTSIPEPVQPAPQAAQPAQPNVPPAQPGQPVYPQPPYPGQGAPGGYGQPPYQGGSYSAPGYIPNPINGMNPAANQGVTQPQFVPQPPKKKKTGLIVGLSVGGGVLLLAIVAVVVWFVVLGGRLPGSGGVGSGVQVGSVMQNGQYNVSCDEYIDAFETQLSAIEGASITVEPYEEEEMDYVILRDGVETEVRLCFYDGLYQVEGSETFNSVMVDSWEIEPMSPLVENVCAAAMMLADPSMNQNAAVEQIRQWDEDNNGYDRTRTLNGISYDFNYLDSGSFSTLDVLDSTDTSILDSSTTSSGSGSTSSGSSSGGYNYTVPLGEYVPDTVYFDDGSTMTYRSFLEAYLEQNGLDPNSTEGQAELQTGLDTSYYFHSDGTVELTAAGTVTAEGTYTMSGSSVQVTISGQTIRMDYDGSTDEVTVYNDAQGLYTVFVYNGM